MISIDIKNIEELRLILEDEFDETISIDEAKVMANNLLELHIVMSQMPRDDQEGNS